MHDHSHESMDDIPKEDPAYPILRRAMRWSLGVSVLMLVGKVGAYWLTGSTAILSDAMESIIHIVATGFAAWSAWFASRPPSKQYPYGHGKIAYFSAGFEGALILIAAISIMYKAIEALVVGPQLRQLSLGLLALVFLTGVNLILGFYLVRTGKRVNSLILTANGKHVLTDMWTSLAVVIGVTIVWLTKIVWLDPIVAIIAALHIMWSAFALLKESIQGLLDRAHIEVYDALASFLNKAVEVGELSDFHQLRCRSIQEQLWIEVHLLLPSQMPLDQAHAIASDLEAGLTALFPHKEVWITSHIEPEAHNKAHPDGHAKPPIQ